MTREAWERSVKPSFRHGWFDSSTWHRAPMVQRIGLQPPKLATQVRVLLGARWAHAAGRTPRLIVQGTARLRPKEQAGVRIVLSRPDARARSCPLSLATRPMSTVADELRPESRKPSGTEVVEARARRHVIGQQVSVVKRPGTGVRDCVVTAIERELIRQRRDQRQRVPGLGQCELGWPRALQTPAPPHRRTRPLGTAPRRNRRLGSRHLDLRRNRPHLRPRRRMRARARLSRPCPLSLGRWPIRYRPIRWEE